MFRILVVEDDRVIADKIKIHLERWGYQIECAADFANVLAHFNRFCLNWC